MFDPSYPPTNAEIESAPLRNQLTSLKALIDALSSINAAVVDGVTTANPGDPASVNVSVVGTELHFTFAIPRGDDGATGADGAQGPPFASAVVDAVNTLSPGDPASVSTSFDGTNVHFIFGIPRGNDGSNGNDGATGEVTNAQLNSAINGTSNNTNGVGTLDLPFPDPDLDTLRNKVNELISALRR